MEHLCHGPLTPHHLPPSLNPVNLPRETCQQNPRDAALSLVVLGTATSGSSSALLQQVGTLVHHLNWIQQGYITVQCAIKLGIKQWVQSSHVGHFLLTSRNTSCDFVVHMLPYWCFQNLQCLFIFHLSGSPSFSPLIPGDLEKEKRRLQSILATGQEEPPPDAFICYEPEVKERDRYQEGETNKPLRRATEIVSTEDCVCPCQPKLNSEYVHCCLNESNTNTCLCSSGWDRGEETVSGRHGVSRSGRAVQLHHQLRDIPGK